MDHYKSWSDLNKRLTDFLCPELRGQITYFLTRYREVHNAYGRASVRLNGKELVCFSWIDQYRQERQLDAVGASWENIPSTVQENWNREGTFCEFDFLQAATDFLQMPIAEALNSENLLLRMFAILDRRVGKRTLQSIREKEAYLHEPEWLRQFYLLRFSVE